MLCLMIFRCTLAINERLLLMILIIKITNASFFDDKWRMIGLQLFAPYKLSRFIHVE